MSLSFSALSTFSNLSGATSKEETNSKRSHELCVSAQRVPVSAKENKQYAWRGRRRDDSPAGLLRVALPPLLTDLMMFSWLFSS